MKHLRWISLLLILVMSVTLLASCKGSEEEELGFTETLDGNFDKDNGDKKPSEEEPSDEDPTEDEPSKDEPSDEEPSDEPSDNDPTEDEPSEDEPSKDEPSKDEPSNEDPSDEPSKDEPSKDEPSAPGPVEKESSGTPVTILVQNLKHAGTSLGEKNDGTGNNIYNRIRRFRAMVDTHDPDVILGQEGRIGWTTAFESELFADYTVIWQKRGPGDVPGGDECTPLLWKTKKYTKLNSGFFWLSETPQRPSTSYDDKSAYGRIITWAQLKDKATGVEFYVYSNHFGFGETGQLKSQEQLGNTVADLEDGTYAFIGGDWNVLYRSDDYKVMMEWDKLMDLRDVAMNMHADGLTELGGMYGSGTAGRFDKNEEDPTPGNKHQIDYLMAKPNPHMAIDYYGFDYTHYAYPIDDIQSGYIADHYGLVVKLRLDTDADYTYYQTEHDYGNNPIYWR